MAFCRRSAASGLPDGRLLRVFASERGPNCRNRELAEKATTSSTPTCLLPASHYMSSQKKPPEDELHNGFLRHALAIGPRRPFLLSGGTFREIQTIRHLLIVIAASASAVSRLSIRIGSRRAARTTTPLGATSTDMLRRTVAPALEDFWSVAARKFWLSRPIRAQWWRHG